MSTATLTRAPEADDLLRAFSKKQVAGRLGVSLCTVVRMIDAGELAAIYPRGHGKGKPVRITEAELRRVFGYGGDAS